MLLSLERVRVVDPPEYTYREYDSRGTLWCDMMIFVGNFQGTYVRPGNSWDLKGCHQKNNESLRDYVRRFSKQCTELPSVTHVEVINAFLEGTTCRNLVHELARSGRQHE